MQRPDFNSDLLPEIQDWGLIDYDKALERQEGLVQRISGFSAEPCSKPELGPQPGVLVFCTHPPTVTLGRKTETDDVFDWHGPRFEINRGGRATYHGPSQLVAYPIWNLASADHEASWPQRDIHFYLRTLEKILIKTVGDFGISATNHSGREDLGSSADPHDSQTTTEDETSRSKMSETGLWVDGRKLGSIGIGIRKWVSFHGVALNVDHDPAAFHGIRPCGLTPDRMVSMEQLLGRKVDRSAVQARFARHFGSFFLN